MLTQDIRILGHVGTWYVIDEADVGDQTLYLLESEKYGDEAACIIVDKNFNIVLEDVWNGFDDYYEYLE